jgi:hypothetical protein
MMLMVLTHGPWIGVSDLPENAWIRMLVRVLVRCWWMLVRMLKRVLKAFAKMPT